jgi:ubiquinone/menaquinone biosynthesis C-methylase UbiE
MKNLDKKTVQSFSHQWLRYDQSGMTHEEAAKIFKSYFSIFPWKKISRKSEGFDMGCGTGRWAKFVAPKVGKLHCIDPSEAIKVAKKKLKYFKNIVYHQKSLDNSGLKNNSQDFGYLLGVLHYVPDAQAAIKSCAKLLKPGSPLLLYIYYSLDNRPMWFKWLWILSNFMRLIISRSPKFLNFFICDFIALFIYYSLDNRPMWFKWLWILSNFMRLIISRSPKFLNFFICDFIALFIYYPFAKFSFIIEKLGLNFKNFPLHFYRNLSFYVMRTDSRDRFGTPLEKRYSKKEILNMMKQAGFKKIKFKNSVPYWTVVGCKR